MLDEGRHRASHRASALSAVGFAYVYSAARQLIDRARVSTQQWLEEGGLERATIPTQIQEYWH
jgi:hypothetical protein